MPLRPLDSWEAVGRRVAEARRLRGLTQAELASRLGLDRTAVAKLEAGNRGLSSLELAHLASELARPIEWFVSESPPAVVSRRSEAVEPARDEIGRAAEDFARDVELLSELGSIKPVERAPAPFPANAQDAEAVATAIRRALEIPDGPLTNFGEAADRLGCHFVSLELGAGADGAYLALEGAGAAMINGAEPAGRRRFTAAHELGHHVFADEYSTDWAVGESRDDRERTINAFAIHFLLRRSSVSRGWREAGGEDDHRTATLRLAVDYRVSWSAACQQLLNLELLDHDSAAKLRAQLPSKSEHLELGLFIVEDFRPPYVSPAFARVT